MSYSKFKKLDTLRKELGIKDIQKNWLPQAFNPMSVSQNLMENLLAASQEALGSEKAKSEYVITPILRELRKQKPNLFKSFSGYQFSEIGKQKSLHRLQLCAAYFYRTATSFGSFAMDFR